MTAPLHRFLFLIAGSPWQPRAQATLDLLMTAAVLDQPVTLCFTGAGVLHLQAGQDGSALGLKTLSQQYPALELYGIEQVYAQASALQDWGLLAAGTNIPVQAVSETDIARMIRDADVVHRCH